MKQDQAFLAGIRGFALAAFTYSAITVPQMASGETYDSFIPPSVSMTIWNDYQGERQHVTSETWFFQNRCDYNEWFKAFATIAMAELEQYKIGYSHMTMDIEINGPSGSLGFNGIAPDMMWRAIAIDGNPIQAAGENLIFKPACYIS